MSAQNPRIPDESSGSTNDPANPLPKTKIAIVISLLSRPEGASLEMLVRSTGWQAHSVRGVMAGTIKKKIGLTITSEKIGGLRIYRIAPELAA